MNCFALCEEGTNRDSHEDQAVLITFKWFDEQVRRQIDDSIIGNKACAGLSYSRNAC